MPLIRGGPQTTSPSWDPENGRIDLGGTGDIDAVVHLAGENLAAGRWNDRRKCRIYESRVKGTRLLAEALAKRVSKPSVIICASGVGFYGDTEERFAEETSPPGKTFLAEVCVEWENAGAPAVAAGIRVVNARLGIVLTPEGGALRQMLPLFRRGLGGTIGSGEQYMSWVSIDDVVCAMRFLMTESSIDGPVNVVAPTAVTNREFTGTMGRVLHRPTLLPVPAFAARVVLGEMADELVLTSTRAVPEKLVASGHTFCHPELKGALEYLLRRRRDLTRTSQRMTQPFPVGV